MKDQVGLLGVSFAFGLTVVAMAYSIGHISGAHLNPAVSFGVLIAGKISSKDFVGYAIAQIIGAITAAAMLYTIVMGKSNGYNRFASQ